ncbi:helix-turn-helix transcriptional regulator [Saccharopolyspora taberi]|uniref:HTH luxR-type domain-containing protein n=1 Tax=Saccharopolyspora taberi TaxID=60895 RepID=A0ABN3VCC6_9PSEU
MTLDQSTGRTHGVEYLVDAAEVRARIHRLACTAQTVRTCITGHDSAPELQSGGRRGLVLVEPRAAARPGALDELVLSATPDVEVRVNHGPLHRMIVFDDRFTLLPFDLLRLGRGAYLFHAAATAPHRSLFDLLWNEARTPETPANQSLSRRELEVARLLIDGATDTEVADRLHVSARTVRTVVAGLQQRYGTHSRMALGFHLARDERITGALIPAPRGRQQPPADAR